MIPAMSGVSRHSARISAAHRGGRRAALPSCSRAPLDSSVGRRWLLLWFLVLAAPVVASEPPFEFPEPDVVLWFDVCPNEAPRSPVEDVTIAVLWSGVKEYALLVDVEVLNGSRSFVTLPARSVPYMDSYWSADVLDEHGSAMSFSRGPIVSKGEAYELPRLLASDLVTIPPGGRVVLREIYVGPVWPGSGEAAATGCQVYYRRWRALVVPPECLAVLWPEIAEQYRLHCALTDLELDSRPTAFPGHEFRGAQNVAAQPVARADARP